MEILKIAVSDESENIGTNKWMGRFVGFLVWTIIGLSFASRTYIAYSANGLNPSWKEIYSSNLTDYYLWGAASPFIFYLCRRYPIEREKFFSRICLFVLIGVPLTFVILALSVVVFWNIGYVNPERSPTFSVMFSKTIVNIYLIHQFTFIYLVTVISGQAFEYYRQLRAGKLRAAELAGQLAQVQLAALKMQIHPHFLFNTLNSISALLRRDVEAADRMIARLSDFLRMTLRSSNEPIIKLAQELEFLHTYLAIEKIRFQDRLIVEILVEPETLKAQVPNLILQPLVENALRHGLSQQTSIGRLRVRASLLGDRLIIQVEDNGQGMSYNDAATAAAARSNWTGLGIANTRARLRQVYHEDFLFEITDQVGSQGTIVTMNFPCAI